MCCFVAVVVYFLLNIVIEIFQLVGTGRNHDRNEEKQSDWF